MKERYDVELDATAEIITSIGSKDAIAHLPLAVVNPGEVVLEMKFTDKSGKVATDRVLRTSPLQ